MSERVCAVVVTYNRKELLRRCLKGLNEQTRRPDHILVVDNASTDGTVEMLQREFPEVELLRLQENKGGAGGFYRGMKKASEDRYDWIWLMDDDGLPVEDCLQHLLTHNHMADVLVPVQVDSAGRRYGAGYWKSRPVPADLAITEGIMSIELFTFVGPLIHSRVIQTVGLPRTDFFICADDWEYSLRVRRAQFRSVVVLDGLFFHDYGGKPITVKRFGRTSIRNPKPAWKYYYSTRNELLMLRSLRLGERLQSYVWAAFRLLRYTLGDLLYEMNWKKRLRCRWLGFLHGTIGVSGKKVDPSHG